MTRRVGVMDAQVVNGRLIGIPSIFLILKVWLQE